MNTTQTGIKCGKCTGYHSSVAEVKACSLGQPTAPAEQPTALQKFVTQHSRNDRVRQSLGLRPMGGEQSGGTAPQKPARPFDRPAKQAEVKDYPPSEKALKYAKDRLDLRQWVPTKDANGVYTDHLSRFHLDLAMRVLAGKPISAEQCSDLIEALGKCPYKAKTATPAAPQAPEHKATATASAEVQRLLAQHQVPDGGYAVEDEDGVLHFYVVKVVHKDSGRRGLRERASDTLHRMYAGQQLGALRRIVEAGLKAAAERYADELEICYACHRTLTDETSRALGIGPICRNHGLAL